MVMNQELLPFLDAFSILIFDKCFDYVCLNLEGQPSQLGASALEALARGFNFGPGWMLPFTHTNQRILSLLTQIALMHNPSICIIENSLVY